MGYYEPWDNVWGDKGQILGWLCPKCEKFVPRNEEHICEAPKSEPRTQVFAARQEEQRRQGSATGIRRRQ